MYKIEISHAGLNKYRVITGREKNVVEMKARTQLASWAEIWSKQLERQNKEASRAFHLASKEAKKDSAALRTREAAETVAEREKLLIAAVKDTVPFDWQSTKSTAEFPEPRPQMPSLPTPPREPSPHDREFNPTLGFFDKILSFRRERIRSRSQEIFNGRLADWRDKNKTIESEIAQITVLYNKEVVEWQNEKAEFDENRDNFNASMDKLRSDYIEKDPQAVIDYCEIVLSNSVYPDNFPRDWIVDFDDETGILVVEYRIPSLADTPTLKEVKYIATRDTFEEVRLKESAINSLYDSIVYQISLRTVHELFGADSINALKAIVFNGWVNYISAATGTEIRACIVSLHVNPQDFSKINLAAVEPKACFRALKGVGSSQLHAMAPVQPLIQLDRTDSRFVASVDVAQRLDKGTNLAAIGWEEFEHLIREIFQREFSSNGGEVKVTQASRDGGVDAVAFDPDPIRGGKIVIQAKRYTNTVDVSAVRDLYGTVMNEGATKGILVTTSNFGPDAYNFAKDKPLTLMNGNNLLFLLSKHGHQARIDLAEAKKLGLSMHR